MTIAWTHFTPWTSLAGGVAIGLAAALYVLGAGRIAGVSGIVGGALQSLLGRSAGASLSWAFIVGLLLAPAAWQLVAPLPPVRDVAGTGLLIAAGLLVGIGTRLGQGCTSGHGICGLSRRSPRSLVNVAVFMAAGVATVFVLRQLV
jgi:uncharacterized membrane protein YedE/YeeE